MEIDAKTGLIVPVRYIPSPNANERPLDTEIDLLVIHNITLPPNEFNSNYYIDDLFTNTLDPHLHPYFAEIIHLRVSAHCFIDRQGEITQYVPFTERAWHAGESNFLGRENCNDFSIGIELEGTDDIPYTDVQYGVLSELTRLILQAYPKITFDRIVGHSTIAPTRKTDPGPTFDWQLLTKLIKK